MVRDGDGLAKEGSGKRHGRRIVILLLVCFFAFGSIIAALFVYSLVHHYRATALYEDGEKKASVLEYRRALLVNPFLAVDCRRMAEALASIGDYDGAISVLEKLVKTHSNDAASHNDLASSLRLKGDFEKAIFEYEKAVDIDADFSLSWWGMGKCYLETGDPDKAKDCFEHALRCAHPDSMEAKEAREYLDKL